MVSPFAGDRMRMSVDEKGTATFTFDDTGTGRGCGSCSLCCRLVPVKSIGKPAGVRCGHQRHGKGCSIYHDRPLDCRSWGCRWLVDPEASDLSRPDRSHVVVDMMEDFIESKPHDGGPSRRLGVIQIWADPAFPEAHRAPSVRAYMAMMAERHRLGALVRWSSSRATLVLAPCLSGDGWVEVADSEMRKRPELPA